MLKKQILIVDDDKNILSSLKLLLKEHFEVITAENGKEALMRLSSDKFNLVLLDLMMPEMDGIETLKKIKNISQDIPVIMLSGAGEIKDAVTAIKLGASDYICKPFDVEHLTSTLVNISNDTLSTEDIISLNNRTSLPQGDFGPLVGKSDVMIEVFQKVETIAKNNTTVLIAGESGTGKELIARQIHQLSPRKDKPFIALNCAAIAESLIESELFGHKKGAFTNADTERKGFLELAHNGTLFLDEIGELNPAVQVKLLRFLQDKTFYKVGSSTPQTVDVRIITATNQDLKKLIKEKKFREDLYFRINVVNITIPPLRDRFDDIEHLISHFIEKYKEKYEIQECSFSEDALAYLREYNWPGNVRELENLVESLLAFNNKEVITAENIPDYLKTPDNSYQLKHLANTVFKEGITFEQAEKQFEYELIVKALKRSNFVQTRAAELLGISRRILKYKMDKLGITSEYKEHL